MGYGRESPIPGCTGVEQRQPALPVLIHNWYQPVFISASTALLLSLVSFSLASLRKTDLLPEAMGNSIPEVAMRYFLISAASAILILTGCGGKPTPDKLAIKGKDTVCILSKSKPFKNDVITRIVATLETNGLRVVRDDTGRAEYFRAADYGAVVYIAEYWAWHTPRHAILYFERNGQAANIVFVVTSGDPDVTIRRPFDAITSASSSKNVDRVSEEILGRLDGILK